MRLQNKPRFIGITGTNGKTTATWLVRSILQVAGYRCAVIGTLSGKLTTPSPWHLKRLIRRYRHCRYDWVIMEVSSHGIHQNRIAGIPYTLKALTNITQDHLDYHKTMEAYQRVKLDWFCSEHCLRATFWPPAIAECEKRGIPLSPSLRSAERDRPAIAGRGRGTDHDSFYEENRRLAAEICRQIGIAPAIIELGLKNAPQVPGRFEFIHCGQPFSVVVDFAHTPDGLEKVLKEARWHLGEGEGGRLIVVFGCGGDRDKTKRPMMGKLAAELADVVIITSDNPRSEDPNAIIEEVLAGATSTAPADNHQTAIESFPDRAVAIERALTLANPDDFVLLAGKGHETTQIFKNERIHFNDKETAERYLENRFSKKTVLDFPL